MNSSDGALQLPVNRIRDDEVMHERSSCLSHLVALRLRDKSTQRHETLGLHKQRSRSFLVRRAQQAKLEDFSCEELAERVVSQAKVRLKRQKRAANVLQKIYQPKAITLSPATAAFRTSTPVGSKSSTPKSLSPVKNAVNTTSPERPNRSLRSAEGGRSRECPVAVSKVVYWSEKQSSVEKDSGIPSVPPSTPKQGQSQAQNCCAFTMTRVYKHFGS